MSLHVTDWLPCINSQNEKNGMCRFGHWGRDAPNVCETSKILVMQPAGTLTCIGKLAQISTLCSLIWLAIVGHSSGVTKRGGMGGPDTPLFQNMILDICLKLLENIS